MTKPKNFGHWRFGYYLDIGAWKLATSFVYRLLLSADCSPPYRFLPSTYQP